MYILTITGAGAGAAATAVVVGLDAGASLSWPASRSWQVNPLRRPLQQYIRTNTVLGQLHLSATHQYRST